MVLHAPVRTDRDLKKFALTMVTVLIAISALAVWNGSRSFWVVAGLSLAFVFACFGLLSPQILRPVERLWLAFGERLGLIMSVVVLSLLFVFVLTPLGLLARLFQRDPLSRKIQPQAGTYWSPCEKDGPGSRPYRPY